MNDQMKTRRASAIHFASAGFKVLPVKDKKAQLKWENATDSIATIKMWALNREYDGFAALMGGGVYAVDADSYKPEFNPFEGYDASPVTQKTSGGGTHYFYRCEGQAPTWADNENAIDLRGDDGYVVCYETPDFDQMPLGIPPARRGKVSVVESVVESEATRPIEWIVGKLNRINPNLAYEKWIEVIFAVQHVSGGSVEALTALESWSAKSKKHHSTIEASDEAKNALRKRWDEAATSSEPRRLGVDRIEELAVGVVGKSSHDWKSIIMNTEDVMELPPTEWLIDFFIAENSVNLFVGGSKSGKSTLFMSLLETIGRGEEWCGLKGNKPVRCLYITEENARKKQVNMLWLGIDKGKPFMDIVERYEINKLLGGQSLYDNLESLGNFIMQMPEEERYNLIIIDTMLAFASGVQSNSQDDVANLYSKIRNVFDGGGMPSVILFSHTTKENENAANNNKIAGAAAGSYMFGAQADNVYQMFYTEGRPERKISFKGRDHYKEGNELNVTLDTESDVKTYSRIAGSGKNKDAGLVSRLFEGVESFSIDELVTAYRDTTNTVNVDSSIKNDISKLVKRGYITKGPGKEPQYTIGDLVGKILFEEA